ncbi:tRNA threonylcarbamoyladenosine dehydratase 1 [Choanephora cucurbitarum]|uniref:tRNA threonylcarbamoyladenosine dehydratase 1 n=1 Tax=Choanephora cucurbitarum TaxID=101091 RepID=A0A1C7N0I0_9FUNG|nr:tRNA threonylcarbamoyladenosine dehydratase 1 [Choanephora cucurbitarum]
MDESLILELLARNIAFFGPDHVAAIRRSRVIVLGTGAIGSWTAVMLARSGIEHLTLIDRGLIRIESLTRHAVATSMDIGKPKVEVMKRYLREIAPQAHIEAVVGSLTAETLDQLVTPVDFVVDTLTDVRDKVLVAAYCKENNIRLVSAMSAGAKADPSLIQVTDISDTMADPLARTYRRQLRKLNVDRDLPVVYSIEKNRQVGKVPDFTTRSLPVLSPVASMFGMALVTYVVVQLGGFTAYKLPANKIRDGVFSRMQKELAAKEEFVFNNKSDHLSVNQVGYVFDELWQGKSVVSGAQDRMLVLTRWDRSKPSSLTNTVVMTKEEAAVHDKLSQDISLVSYYGEAIVNKVEQQFRLEEKLERLWHQ